ncbi:Bor/Iss family lipoprotein [Aeromonas veronii]
MSGTEKVVYMINCKTITVTSLLTVLLCGCAKNTVHSDGSQTIALNKGAIIHSEEITSHFFFSDVDFGLNDKIDAAAICYGVENVVQIETKREFWDSVFGSLSAGLYAPRTTRIDCAG